jgi:hypothetical protein
LEMLQAIRKEAPARRPGASARTGFGNAAQGAELSTKQKERQPPLRHHGPQLVIVAAGPIRTRSARVNDSPGASPGAPVARYGFYGYDDCAPPSQWRADERTTGPASAGAFSCGTRTKPHPLVAGFQLPRERP